MTQSPNTAAENSEIALPPGVYAYLQDTGEGTVRTYVGSTLIVQSGQEQPVRYDPQQRLFQASGLHEAICPMPLAAEGDYLVLENPVSDEANVDRYHPGLSGKKQTCPQLLMGSKVNVPGPCQFALWPGQHATLVPGHNLRSNQFLVVRVYNEKAATANWQQAKMVEATPATRVAEQHDDASPPPAASAATETKVTFFVAGQRIIIRGDRISFFIPPTGMEVVAGEDGEYVREAISLERLEYCILIDENGNKRYERGQQVVFPEPTEVFLKIAGNRKFRAYELNPIQGLHLKVITDYNDDGSEIGNADPEHLEGEELFITGEDQPIYFPRPEHSIITYDGQDKHYAVAIPPGEGRYVMNRLSGKIQTVQGAAMQLCDPRTEVIVKRVLTDKQTDRWYPGNAQALAYNRDLAAEATSNATSARGYVERERGGSLHQFAAGTMQPTATAPGVIRERTGRPTVADGIERGTAYHAPRTLTIDSKFEGVPQICPWTGYAVRIVSKSGGRRTVLGPDTLLLDFDEELETLLLSTGKPKTTDSIKKTSYLQVRNNKISDIVEGVQTSDHVPFNLKLSFTVDFEGDKDRWFDIENYVKFLTDHVRSVLKGRIRQLDIKEFWSAGADYIRDFILGSSPEDGDRPGMVFKQNGMRITDVEILSITVMNEDICQLLEQSEEAVVRDNIGLEKADRDLHIMQSMEAIMQHRQTAKHVTTTLAARLEQELIVIANNTDLAVEDATRKVEEAAGTVDTVREANRDAVAAASLTRRRNDAAQNADECQMALSRQLAQLEAETTAKRESFAVLQTGFTEALLTLSNQDTMTKIAQAGSVQQMLGGGNLVEVLQQILTGADGVVPAAFVKARAAISAVVPASETLDGDVDSDDGDDDDGDDA